MIQRHNQRGQSTVEFALVMPLFALSLALLVGTTMLCLRFIALHDIARTAARAASTSLHPRDAARSVISDSSITVHVSEDIATDVITVTVQQSAGLWWFTRFLPGNVFQRSVSMMREAPIVFNTNTTAE